MSRESELHEFLPTPKSLAVEVVDRVGITGVAAQLMEEIVADLLSDKADLDPVA